MDTRTLILISPEIIVSVTAILILLLDALFKENRSRHLAYPIILILFLVAGLCATFFGTQKMIFNGMFSIDSFSIVLKIILLIAASLVLMLSVDYLTFPGAKSGEYYALVLFAITGMMIMISANDLIILFLGLQLNSIPFYVLSGFQKFDQRSNEASLKYLLLGMVAAIIMLYGMSLIYGLTSTTKLPVIARQLVGSRRLEPALFVGMVFILGGFTFKIAVVPFHFWAPDVYEGAPTPISGFIATAPKCAGVAAILRILLVAFPAVMYDWRVILIILSVLSMTIGNLLAIGQKNIKRMLAYSGIAHVGYILVAIAAASKEALSSIVFYLAVYVLVTLGAFAVVVATTKISPEHRIEDLSGLSRRSPFLAVALATFMISLLGIPPTPGFWGKLFLFRAAWSANLDWLVVVAVINCVISAVYYVNVIRHLYVIEPKSSEDFRTYWLVGVAVLVILIVTVAMVYPSLLLKAADSAKIALAQFR